MFGSAILATTMVPPLELLTIRDGPRTLFVPMADILWVDSLGNYAVVHTSARRYIHRGTMARLAAELGPHGFTRIHRKVIVNARRVVRLRSSKSGHFAQLDTGTRLRIGRTFEHALMHTWDDWHHRGPSGAGIPVLESFLFAVDVPAFGEDDGNDSSPHPGRRSCV
jgi:DNA-binding LytR/AlgR family response regulator